MLKYLKRQNEQTIYYMKQIPIMFTAIKSLRIERIKYCTGMTLKTLFILVDN